MKKLNWILSKNRILVSVWKFYHLSNDCQIAYPALVCSPANRKPCNKHIISVFFFLQFVIRVLGSYIDGKKTRSVIYSTDRKLCETYVSTAWVEATIKFMDPKFIRRSDI